MCVCLLYDENQGNEFQPREKTALNLNSHNIEKVNQQHFVLTEERQQILSTNLKQSESVCSGFCLRFERWPNRKPKGKTKDRNLLKGFLCQGVLRHEEKYLVKGQELTARPGTYCKAWQVERRVFESSAGSTKRLHNVSKVFVKVDNSSYFTGC